MIQTLGDVKNVLDMLFMQEQPEANALALLQQMSELPFLQYLLQGLLADEAQLQRVASMSYHHRNGFDRIVLVKSLQPEYKLRLHIWWPQLAGGVVEAVHNHAWNFSSSVLTGAFQFQVYAVSADRAGEEFCQYQARSDSSLEFVKRTRLMCVYDAVLPTGCRYRFEHTLPHRVRTLPQQTYPTSTLLIQGPAQKNYSDVFVTQLEQGTMPPKFTRDLLREKLLAYMQVLETRAL